MVPVTAGGEAEAGAAAEAVGAVAAEVVAAGVLAGGVVVVAEAGDERYQQAADGSGRPGGSSTRPTNCKMAASCGAAFWPQRWRRFLINLLACLTESHG